MKKRLTKLALCLLAYLCICIMPLNAQSWTTTFNLDAYNQRGTAIVEAPGGGYVIGGQTFGEELGSSGRVFVIFTDTNGVLINQQLLAPELTEGLWVTQIKGTNDGSGYYVSGHTRNIEGDGNGFLIKINLEGQQEFIYTFPEINRVEDFVEATDGNIILVGGTYAPDAPGVNKSYAKVAIMDIQEGALLWAQEYEEKAFFNAVIQTADGHFLMAGLAVEVEPISQLPAEGGTTVLMNADGEILWEYNQSLNTNFTRRFSHINQDADGNYMFMGFYFQNFNFGTTLDVVDANGSLLNSSLIPSPSNTRLDYAYCPGDNALFIIGYKAGGEGPDMQFSQINLSDNAVEVMTVEGVEESIGYGLLITDSGSIIGTGFIESGDSSLVYLVKSDYQCFSPATSITSTAIIAPITTYPNPASDVVHFEFSNHLSLPDELRVVNAAGQVLWSEPVKEHQMSWEPAHLPSGVYALLATKDGAVIYADKLMLK